MKAFYKLSAFIVFLFSIQLVQGQNTLVVENNEVSTQTNFDLDIALNNASAIAAIQFDIEYNKDVLELTIGHQLSARATNHSLAVSQPNEGSIRVIVYSSTNTAITGNAGDLIKLKLKSKTLPGTFNLSITNLVVSDAFQNTVTTTATNGSIKVNGALLNIQSSQINFGRVPLGGNTSRDVSIRNDGNTNLILTGNNDITPFLIQETFPISIAPNTNKNINIAINTANKFNNSKILTFQNNDADPLRKIQSVNLTADVYAVNEIKIGSGNGEINTEITIPVVIENMEPFTGFQFDIKLPNNITYVENSLVVSNRVDGHSISASLIDSNTLRFLGYSPSNKNFKESAGEVFSFKLKPNVDSGNYQLQIQNAILTHATLGNILSDTYNGSISINAPRLSLNNTSINFGSSPITESKKETIRLTNIGNAQLRINEIIFDNSELSVNVSTPLIIEVGQSKDVEITFSPQTSGAFSEIMSFRHNAADAQTILNLSATKFSPNYLVLKDKTITRGENSSIHFDLHNNDRVRAVQFDVNIPNGISLDIATIQAIGRADGYSISGSKINDNTYRILLYTTNDNFINQGQSSIIEAMITVDENLAFGDYEFSFSNVIISGILNDNVNSIPLITGKLTIQNSLSIDNENLNKQILIYPNPFRSILNLKYDNSIKIEKIVVYDILGKEILQITNHFNKLNFSNLVSGILILKIQTNKGSQIKRIIKY